MLAGVQQTGRQRLFDERRNVHSRFFSSVVDSPFLFSTRVPQRKRACRTTLYANSVQKTGDDGLARSADSNQKRSDFDSD